MQCTSWRDRLCCVLIWPLSIPRILMHLFSPRLTIPFCGGVDLQTRPNRRRNIVSCVLKSRSVTVPWRLMAFLAVGRDELAFVGKWVPGSFMYNVTTIFLILFLLLFAIEHILWRQSVCEVLVTTCFFIKGNLKWWRANVWAMAWYYTMNKIGTSSA